MAEKSRHPGIRKKLDALYAEYNRGCWIHPDPLEFLHRHEDAADREIVGLIASCLAYGRVAQILKSVSWVLERMPEPSRFLLKTGHGELRDMYGPFRHRFTTGEDLVDLLLGVKAALETHGSIEACFRAGVRDDEETLAPALSRLGRTLWRARGGESSFLLPDPEKGSACKRGFLFLRWMIRRDNVDPGGWHSISPSRLVVPLDTHMFRIAAGLGFTGRRQADLKTALEVTRRFREINAEDPVKYDFALTRFGIRADLDARALLDGFEAPEEPC